MSWLVTTYPAARRRVLIGNQPPWAPGRRPAPTPPVGEGRPEAEGPKRGTSSLARGGDGHFQK